LQATTSLEAVDQHEVVHTLVEPHEQNYAFVRRHGEILTAGNRALGKLAHVTAQVPGNPGRKVRNLGLIARGP
jgi:hypothetical protein